MAPCRQCCYRICNCRASYAEAAPFKHLSNSEVGKVCDSKGGPVHGRWAVRPIGTQMLLDVCKAKVRASSMTQYPAGEQTLAAKNMMQKLELGAPNQQTHEGPSGAVFAEIVDSTDFVGHALAKAPMPQAVKAGGSGRPGVHGQADGGSCSRVSSSTRAGSEVSHGTQSSSAYTNRSSSSSRRSSESGSSQGTQSSSGSLRTSASSRSSGASQGYQSSTGSFRASASSQRSSCGSQGYQSSSGSTPRSSSSSRRSSSTSHGTKSRSGSTPRSESSSRRSSGSARGAQSSSGSTPRSSSSSRGGTQTSRRSANSTLGDDACIVCYENRANACLAPCGHHNVCMGCANRLNPKLCPCCRAPFSMVIKKVGQ